MTYPKMRPCPKCANNDVWLYGYGDWGTTWHVECDECFYMGPGGNKLQAIREHNALAAAAGTAKTAQQAECEASQSGGSASERNAQPPSGDISND